MLYWTYGGGHIDLFYQFCDIDVYAMMEGRFRFDKRIRAKRLSHTHAR